MKTPTRVLFEDEIRRLVDYPEAIAAVERAFTALETGHAAPPGIMHIDPPGGEIHVKGGQIDDEEYIAIKVATGFRDNLKRGLPSSGGLFLALDAATGLPIWLLMDNGFLTDIRTAAAGAVAARYLAPEEVETVGVFGTGVQARRQVEALRHVRKFKRVLVHGRDPQRVSEYVEDVASRLSIPVKAAPPEEVVRRSDLVITATSSGTPLVRRGWVHPGLHITAVGSDAPWKQELEPEVVRAADIFVVDHLDQCLRLGELHHAVASGIYSADEVYCRLGELTSGKISGRSNESQVTVVDLTGVGVQDTAIANVVCRAAHERGLGKPLG